MIYLQTVPFYILKTWLINKMHLTLNYIVKKDHNKFLIQKQTGCPAPTNCFSLK